MKRPLSYFTLFVMCVMLMLTLAAPVAKRNVKAQGKTLQEKCDECVLRVQERFDQCLAVHGQDHLPCYDQFNEGIVICFRNFCEQ